MTTTSPRPDPDTTDVHYHGLEGFDPPPGDLRPDRPALYEKWRDWTLIAVGLTAVIAVVAVVLALVGLASNDAGSTTVIRAAAVAPATGASTTAAAPTLADAKGIAFEDFTRVDPTLPAIPAGPVKVFDVDVYHHVTQVSKELAPTEVWSFAVNGVKHTGTGVSPPMVVTEGDTVDFTLTNGSTETMNVNLPHSLDFHSAEVNPGMRYADLAPGESMHYRFTADHPGVFMYHCATQPVLLHTGAGMVGMFVVKPANLAPVDKELWITQQEFYIGKPGADADMLKLNAKQPDVIAFNGYGNQYADAPIPVRKDEKVRMYILNAGPSIWSAFHVIGTVFDKTDTDNGTARDVQTVNLAPSQGGWVEFTLEEEGTYPFVTHAFGDMVKGALGTLATPNAPKGAGLARRHVARRCRHRRRGRQRHARRHVDQVRHAVGQGRRGHLRRRERGRDRAWHGHGPDPGRRAGRNARRRHAARQGRRARHRRGRPHHRRAEARRLRAGLLRARPLRRRSEAPVRGHQLSAPERAPVASSRRPAQGAGSASGAGRGCAPPSKA